MRIKNGKKLDFDDVLICPKRSTLKNRSDVDLRRRIAFKWCKWIWVGIPIIASNMDTVGTVEAAKVMDDHEMLTWVHKFVDVEKEGRNLENIMSAARTIGEGDYLSDEQWKPSFIRIDVANGYRESFVRCVQEVRETVGSDVVIFAGNVCTPEMTEQLILSGADVAVVGIGSGAQCITRTKTGVGYPQLSAIIECSDAAHGLGGHIVADGGCKTVGDIAKSFAAGADFVSLGTMLAGHEENTTDENMIYSEDAISLCTYLENTDANGLEDYQKILSVPRYAKVYGMSSKEAMEKHYGGVASHRTDEGISSIIPYKGKLENTLKDILGGLRSTCTYVGASTIKELPKRTTFVRR